MSTAADVLMNAYEPQVVYDSASGRWYVSALDNGNPPYTPFSGTTPGTAANDILLAVSKDSNPLDGWVEFVIPADEYLYLLNPDPLGINPNIPGHRPLRADSDTLGFNAALNSTALVLTANLYDDGSGGPPGRLGRPDRRRPGFDRDHLDSEGGSPVGHGDGRPDRDGQFHVRERRRLDVRNQPAVRGELRRQQPGAGAGSSRRQTRSAPA